MFGDNRKLQSKLRVNGREARARVLEAERTNRTYTRGNDSLAANTKVIWRLKLLVQPLDEPAFEVEIKDGWDQFSSPHVGSMVPVLYDPSNHSKLVLDDSDQAAVETAVTNSQEKAVARGVDASAGSAMADLKREAIADPEGFRRRMFEMRRGGDGPAVVGPDALAGLVSGSGGAAPRAAADPVEQLTKLADLRDRGVLSDEEFEQQKRRILGA
jgi:hypothetical protein